MLEKYLGVIADDRRAQEAEAAISDLVSEIESIQCQLRHLAPSAVPVLPNAEAVSNARLFHIRTSRRSYLA